MVTPEQIRSAIDNGIRYIGEQQHYNGDFTNYWGDTKQTWRAIDQVFFGTAFILSNLSYLKDNLHVKDILEKAVGFTQYSMSHGFWKFYSKADKKFDLPVDIDTTSLTNIYLSALGICFYDNKECMYVNRNKEGMFYTWFFPKLSFLRNRNALKLSFYFLNNIITTFKIFSLINESRGYRIDLGVNINAIRYLGYNERTKPVYDKLRSIFQDSALDFEDVYYMDRSVMLYFFSFVYAKNPEVFVLEREHIVDCIEKEYSRLLQTDKFEDIHLAYLLTSMCQVNCLPELQDEIVSELIERQQYRGNWDFGRVFFESKGECEWGSQESTTSVCLVALDLYLKQGGCSSGL